MSDKAGTTDSVSVAKNSAPQPVIHAGVTLAARTPHLSLFGLSGLVFAISAINNDLGTIISFLMTAMPLIAGFVHLLHIERQNAQAGWVQGTTATPAQLLAQIINLATSVPNNQANVQNLITAFQTAIKTQ